MHLPKADLGEGLAQSIFRLMSTNPSKAWTDLRRALKIFPQSERVAYVAGLMALMRGEKRIARNHFAKAINLRTPSADAYVNYAQLCAEEGLIDPALTALDRGRARFPRDPQLCRARIIVHRITGNPALALHAAEDALDLFPDTPEFQELRGILLADNGRLLDAIAALETLLQDHPDRPVALINLGRFYAFTNQTARGLEVTERAYTLEPNTPAVIDNLAYRKRETGDFDAAATLFRRLATLAPDKAPDALRQLADLVPDGDLAPLAKDVARAERRHTTPEAAALLGFARATIAKRNANPSDFVRAVKDANRKMARLRPYDAAADTAYHSFVRTSFTQEAPVRIDTPPLSATPIFVLGLPRSGTTLLERMLSSGQGVAGLGEVALLHRAFSASFSSDTPVSDGLPALRQRYIDMAQIAKGATWTIDKMPVNYMYIGWINRTFPEARIILLRRDRRDIALSLFENYFSDAGQNFTFQEKGIAHRIAVFEDTIAHWQALNADMLSVSYEDLVSDPETCLKTVCAYTGIPFDPAMLTPERNDDAIRTVSSLQARHKINTNSVARWRNYPSLLPSIFKP